MSKTLPGTANLNDLTPNTASMTAELAAEWAAYFARQRAAAQALSGGAPPQDPAAAFQGEMILVEEVL